MCVLHCEQLLHTLGKVRNMRYNVCCCTVQCMLAGVVNVHIRNYGSSVAKYVIPLPYQALGHALGLRPRGNNGLGLDNAM